MLGLLSGSLMMFADRLFLARYSSTALNACATAGLAFYMLTIIPLITASISEVFVGRSHGAGKMHEVGKAVWQMLWLSWGTFPIFALIAWALPPLLFFHSAQIVTETIYFQWLIYFAPFFCSTIALNGFFVGIGKVHIVTIGACIGNITNIALDILLIFGYGPFPEMGVMGAAIATGISQLVQTVFFFALFVHHRYRAQYHTLNWKINVTYFKESLAIGLPAALSRFLEIIAHFLFFNILKQLGDTHFTIVAVIQSIYLLLSFVVEGLSKAISSIIANLIGGQQNGLIGKVIKAGLLLHSTICCLIAAILIPFSIPLLSLFFNSNESILLHDSIIIYSMQKALLWMTVFFLFDGFCWVYIGFLTAAGDTKFLLYASFILNWLCYLLPAYLILNTINGTAVHGWMLLAIYSCIAFIVYRLRYRSGQWRNSIKTSEAALYVKSAT
jgi:MATE family multidrug resistance protein